MENNSKVSSPNFASNIKRFFFFYLVYFSQPFTNNRTAEEGGGHFFDSSLSLSPSSYTLRH